MSGMFFTLLVFWRDRANRSDVCVSRFHAWQSSLLFTALFVLHLVFSWSRFLRWVFFLGDLVLIAWLVLKAYRDADTLDRLVSPLALPMPLDGSHVDSATGTRCRLLDA